jgi:lipoprotein NlpI
MRGAPYLVSTALALGLVAVVGCATNRDQLARSQSAFDLNEHDRALALLRDLELAFTRLDKHERAQYTYLRGMTDYRIGHRADARYWLGLAMAYEDAAPGTLAADWKARAKEALAEMNATVEQGDLAALAATPGQ